MSSENVSEWSPYTDHDLTRIFRKNVRQNTTRAFHLLWSTSTHFMLQSVFGSSRLVIITSTSLCNPYDTAQFSGYGSLWEPLMMYCVVNQDPLHASRPFNSTRQRPLIGRTGCLQPPTRHKSYSKQQRRHSELWLDGRLQARCRLQALRRSLRPTLSDRTLAVDRTY